MTIDIKKLTLEEIEELKKALGIKEPAPEPEIEKPVKVIQINTDGKEYFCKTEEEKRIFFENNPDAKKYRCIPCGERFNNPAISEGKILVCIKCHSQNIFVNTETFGIELTPYNADKRINNPANKRQFTRKDK